MSDGETFFHNIIMLLYSSFLSIDIVTYVAKG